MQEESFLVGFVIMWLQLKIEYGNWVYVKVTTTIQQKKTAESHQ